MLLSEAQQVFELALIGEVSPATIRWYRQRVGSLVKCLGDVDIERITVDDLRRWRAWLVGRSERYADHPTRPDLPGRLSPWTVNNHVRGVRRFFRWLVEEGHLERNPAERVKPPPLPDEPPKDLNQADLDRLLAAARASGPRNYAIICFLADTGCRVGGLAGLRLDDLDLERRQATVREKGRGGSKARDVYFSHKTAQALQAWLDIRPRTGERYVFLGQRGPLTESGIYQVLKRLARRVGITGRWNPHSFRYGWARGALRKGADLGTVSQLLGHSDISVTARFYARWADPELAERQRKFSWLNSAGDDMSSAEME